MAGISDPTTASRHATRESTHRRPSESFDGPLKRIARRERGAHVPTASGHRLLRSFDTLERFPALGRSRDRLLALIEAPDPDRAELAVIAGSDAALTIALLRAANEDLRAAGKPEVASVAHAIGALSRERLREVVARVPSFGFFAGEALARSAERYRIHALACQQMAERLRCEIDADGRGELAAAALLHDIGKIALLFAYDRYDELARLPGTPEQRLVLERRQLGVDHALAGSVLARRLRLPERISTAIGRHHTDHATGDAAIVRLADMLAHYSAGRPVDRREMRAAAAAIELEESQVEALLGRPAGWARGHGPQFEPSPLSRRQTEILRMLSEGKVYKEIGDALGLTESTIRTHLHLIYRKLRVPDRAQAVLLAAKRGWL